MAFTTTQVHTFQPSRLGGPYPFFELTELRVNTYCVANQNEVSDHYKVYWIEDGDGTYQIDFQEFSIEGSGIFCLSPGQVFTIQSEKVQSAYQIAFDRDFYCVEAHGKAIACNGLLFNNIHRVTAVSFPPEERPVFKNLIQQMVGEIQSPGSAHGDLLRTYLQLFLIQTLRLLEQQDALVDADSNHNQLVRDFIALVEQNFRQDHSVTAYAEKLFVAPKSLTKRLSALNYPTPSQIIRDRLVLEAKRQLKFSDKTVKEVAFELGFDDPAYFSRLFSKAAGQSPAQFRTGN